MPRKIDDIIRDIQTNENSINKTKDANTINELQDYLESERIALLNEYYKASTQKKDKPRIGIVYYMISFILSILLFYFSIISILYGIADLATSGNILVPIIEMIIIIAICASAIFSIVSIFYKCENKHKYIISFLSFFIMFTIFLGIKSVINETATILSVIFESALYSVIGFFIYRYFSKKKTNIRMNFFKTHAPLIINILVVVLFFGTSACVYLYSIVNMFDISTSYGLFGVFVPGIAQFVYLHEVGYDSYYACMCYLLALSYSEIYVNSALFNEE